MEVKPRRRSRGRKAGQAAAGPEAAEILAAEIATLRALMRRVAKLAELDSPDEADLELLKILNSFGQASARLVTMLKAQHGLGGGEDSETAYYQALEEALQELKD